MAARSPPRGALLPQPPRLGTPKERRRVCPVPTALPEGFSESKFMVATIPDDWLAMLARDRKDFHSAALCHEAFLKEVSHITRELGRPNPLSSAAAMMVLDSCIGQKTHVSRVLREVREELLHAVYSLRQSPEAPELRWYVSQPMWKELYHRTKNAFSEYHTVAEGTKSTLARQHVIMGRSISTWQGMLKERYFCAWHNTCKRRRRWLAVVELYTAGRHRKQRLVHAFHSWKHAAAALRSEAMGQQHTETETALRGRVLALQEELHDARAEIRKLDVDKMEMETELASLREQLQERETVIEGLRTELSDVRSQVEEWRCATAEIVASVWPLKDRPLSEVVHNKIEGQPTPRLLSMTSIMSDHTEVSSLVTRPRADGLDRLTKLTAHFAKVAPLEIPPEKLIYLWFCRMLADEGALSEVPGNFGADLRDGLTLAAFGEHCLGIKGLLSKVEREMNYGQRAQSILQDLFRWLGHSDAVTSIDLSEGNIDVNILFIANLLQRTLSPASWFAQDYEQAKLVVEQVREMVLTLPCHAVLDEFRNMQSVMSEWRNALRLVKGFTSKIIAEHAAGRLNVLGSGKKRDFEAMINLNPLRFEDIASASPDMNLEETMAELRTTLGRRFDELLRIWKFYSPDGKVMSPERFWRFVNDCKLGKAVGKKRIAHIFREANKSSGQVKAAAPLDTPTESQAGSDDCRSFDEFCLTATPLMEGETAEVLVLYNPDDKLTQAEWVDCLVHFAYDLYDAPLLSQRVQLLLDGPMRRAGQSTIDELRAHIYQKDVQDVVARYNSALQKVFRHYARADAQGVGGDADISLAEFRAFLKDAKLMDHYLTPETAADIFRNVQEVEEGDNELHVANQTLDYREFLECIVCLTFFKLPAPYAKLADRLQHFLQRILLPNLRSGPLAPKSKKH